MTSRGVHAFIVSGALVVMAAADIADAAARFQGLGDLPGGAVSSHAFAVSADGSVVTGSSDGHAFRWTPHEGMTHLRHTDGLAIQGSPRGISADGSVIVGTASTPNGQRPFRWTEAGGLVMLPTRPGDGDTFATSVSDDGRVTVGYSNFSPFRKALTWTGDGGPVQVLRPLNDGADDSFADGVSADGSMIVGSSTGGGRGAEPVRWTASGDVMALGGGPFEPAFDVTPDGSVIVGANFRWSQSGGYRRINYGFAQGVSADGRIVVGGGTNAFIWDEQGGPPRLLKDVLEDDHGLDLTGWTLTNAYDISNDGTTIVGWGTNPAGQTEGYIAVIPEPASVTLITIALLSGFQRRRPCGHAPA